MNLIPITRAVFLALFVLTGAVAMESKAEIATATLAGDGFLFSSRSCSTSPNITVSTPEMNGWEKMPCKLRLNPSGICFKPINRKVNPQRVNALATTP